MIDASLAYAAASTILHVCSAEPANYAGIAAHIGKAGSAHCALCWSNGGIPEKGEKSLGGIGLH